MALEWRDLTRDSGHTHWHLFWTPVFGCGSVQQRFNGSAYGGRPYWAAAVIPRRSQELLRKEFPIEQLEEAKAWCVAMYAMEGE